MKLKTIIKRGFAITFLLVVGVFFSYYYDSSVPAASASTELDFPVEIKREATVSGTLCAGILISPDHYSRQNVLRIIKWYLKTREPKDSVLIQVFTKPEATESILFPVEYNEGFVIYGLSSRLRKAYNTRYDAEWEMDSSASHGRLSLRVFLTIRLFWKSEDLNLPR